MLNPYETPSHLKTDNPERNKILRYLIHEAPRPKGRDFECCIAVLTHVLTTTKFTKEQAASLVFDHWRSQDFADPQLIVQLAAEAEGRLKNPKHSSSFPPAKPAGKQSALADASTFGNTIVGRLISAGNGYKTGLIFGLNNMSLKSLPNLDEKVIGPFPAAFEQSAKIGLSDGLKILILNERNLSGGDK